MTPDREGREAYCEGLELDDCPYHPNSREAANWCAGWADAENNDPFKDDFQ